MGSPLSIDLHDPAVQHLLGGPPRTKGVDPGTGAMVQIAGDAPDPNGSGMMGLASTTRLDGTKREVLVTYKGRAGELLLTVDVIPGDVLEVLFICPRCTKAGRITGDRKHIEFDPTATRPFKLPNGQPAMTGGELSIEAFMCTQELPEAQYEQHTKTNRHGLSLCKQTLVIDRNIARDAK